MSIGVGIHWKYRVITDGDLFDHADRLMQTLLALEDSTPGLQDSAVSADRGEGVVEIEVSAVADTEDEAIKIGQDAVAAAIRNVGGSVVSLPTSLETSPLAMA